MPGSSIRKHSVRPTAIELHHTYERELLAGWRPLSRLPKPSRLCSGGTIAEPRVSCFCELSAAAGAGGAQTAAAAEDTAAPRPPAAPPANPQQVYIVDAERNAVLLLDLEAHSCRVVYRAPRQTERILHLVPAGDFYAIFELRNNGNYKVLLANEEVRSRALSFWRKKRVVSKMLATDYFIIPKRNLWEWDELVAVLVLKSGRLLVVPEGRREAYELALCRPKRRNDQKSQTRNMNAVIRKLPGEVRHATLMRDGLHEFLVCSLRDRSIRVMLVSGRSLEEVGSWKGFEHEEQLQSLGALAYDPSHQVLFALAEWTSFSSLEMFAVRPVRSARKIGFTDGNDDRDKEDEKDKEDVFEEKKENGKEEKQEKEKEKDGKKESEEKKEKPLELLKPEVPKEQQLHPDHSLTVSHSRSSSTSHADDRRGHEGGSGSTERAEAAREIEHLGRLKQFDARLELRTMHTFAHVCGTFRTGLLLVDATGNKLYHYLIA